MTLGGPDGKGKMEKVGPVFLETEFSSVKCSALVDTGASDCFMSYELWRAIRATRDTYILSQEPVEICLADKTSQKTWGSARVPLKINNIPMYCSFHIVQGLAHKAIVGRTLLAALRAKPDVYRSHIDVFTDIPISLVEAVHLEPGQEKIVPVSPWTIPPDHQSEVLCTPSNLTMVCVANAINNSTAKIWYLKLANITDKTITVAPEEVVAYAEVGKIPPISTAGLNTVINANYAQVDDYNEKPRMPLTPEKRDLIAGIDLSQTKLTPQQRQEMRELLLEYHDVLAFSSDELGHCKISPMKIRVDESKGISTARPYRYPPQKLEIINSQIQQLLHNGVIEPSESAWRSPIVLVQKKDKTPRLCIDFRYLNMITCKDKYPMPTARSLFLYIAYRKPTIFTTIDLLSGYHQVEITPDSRKYTAFETPGGVWQWKRMPFGLVGAPWWFSKIMAIALGDLVPKVCLSYLDDVIIFDSSFKDHKESLEKVMGALRNAGLKIKPSKCEFCKEKIDFLGHVITGEGIGTQTRITTKIAQFKPPTCQKTLKSFLGLCNYYRGFLPGYATLTAPLNHLLRKGVDFAWTADCQTNFEKIREALTSPELLIHPQIPHGHFYVLTDSSQYGCGAAICHKINDIYRPILYYSYTMNSAEKNYSTTEQEALAVVRTLDAHQQMLNGQKITIVTDHKPLLALLQQAHKAPSARLKRWALALSDYDFNIVHESGINHHLPDYLSRIGCDPMDESATEYEPSVGGELMMIAEEEPGTQDNGEASPITDQEFRDAQLADEWCVDIITFIAGEGLPEGTEKARRVMLWAENMIITDTGLLSKMPCMTRQKKNPNALVELRPRIVVPKVLVNRVMSLLHDDILCGGHVGQNAMCKKVLLKYWWRNMHSDIVRYVRECETCGLRKRAPHYKAPAKTWENPGAPWKEIQCDFMGKLRTAETGERYIITFIDLFSGWPEAFPTVDCSAATTAQVFVENIVCRVGKVGRLHTDRGANFIANYTREVTDRLGTRQSYTSARLATGNARIERLHRTLWDVMAVYSPESHDQWPRYLPIALWTVRSTISNRTGFSPYNMIYGRDPPAMVVADYDDIKAANNNSQYFLALHDRLCLFKKMAAFTVKAYNEEMNKKIDVGARPSDLQEGDLVYYYDPPPASAERVAKLAPRYKGPYRIVQVKDDHLLQLKSLKTGQIIPHYINVQKVKRAYTAQAPALDYDQPQRTKNPVAKEPLPVVTGDSEPEKDTETPKSNETRQHCRYALRNKSPCNYKEDVSSSSEDSE